MENMVMIQMPLKEFNAEIKGKVEEAVANALDQFIKRMPPPAPPVSEPTIADKYISRKDTKTALEKSYMTLNKWVRQGKLTPFTLGGCGVYFLKEEVLALFEKKK